MTADRSDPNYMRDYYAANKEKWRRTPEQKERRKELRRKKYAEDEGLRKRLIQQVKESRARNPLTWRARVYGLTKDQVETMLDKGCQICHAHPEFDPTVKMHIDHDHKTGKVRGALCQPCNLALGHMQDDPIRIAAMLTYVMGASISGSSGADSMTSRTH